MLEIIITSSLLTGLLILMRRLCRNRISSRLQYALWLLAALRLLTPVALFENPFNIMNWLHPATERITEWAAETEAEVNAAIEEKQLLRKSTGNDQEEGRPLRKSAKDSPVEEQPVTQTGQASPPREYPMPDLKTSAITSENSSFFQENEPDYFSLGQLLRNAWYTGMAAMGIWTITVNLLCRRRLSRKREYLGREGRVMIYVSGNAGTPCLLGVLHPVIYLTPGSVRTQKHREYAIAHELTHYRHGDHIWVFARRLCLIIYWFNPLVWMGVRLAAQDCELACDEGVLRLLGVERAQEYGCTLIEMAASFRRPWLLSCETALASGKRELKERIARIAAGKKKTGLLAVSMVIVCGSGLTVCTFGKTVAAPAMGRYVETAVELTGTASRKTFPAIAQEGKTIRLIAYAGCDILSSDGGITFETIRAKDMPQGTMELYKQSAIGTAGSTDGARAFQTCDFTYAKGELTFDNFLITENGEEFRLPTPEKSHTLYFYSNDSFFAVEINDPANRYYKINPVTGEMQFLMENEWAALHAAADEKLLYLTGESGVLLYDLETGEIAAEQDRTLSDFVAENASSAERYSVILYPYRGGVYLLTHSGLYWHALYDKNIEQVIDGTFCAMSHSKWAFTGMALRETGAEPEFLILYDDKYLMRYTYDTSLPAVPDISHPLTY